MNAPMPVLWALSALFVVLTLPCAYRLVRAHPTSGSRCRVNGPDETAEVLMCLGMLAMVSPLGGPIPLAGWLAVFVVVAVAFIGIGVVWTRAPSCAPGRGRHHAIMASAMVYMLAAMAGHSGHSADPWLMLAGHHGVLPVVPLTWAFVAYLGVDLVLCAVRIARHGRARASAPWPFDDRARDAARATMGASMVAMLVSMA